MIKLIVWVREYFNHHHLMEQLLSNAYNMILKYCEADVKHVCELFTPFSHKSIINKFIQIYLSKNDSSCFLLLLLLFYVEYMKRQISEFKLISMEDALWYVGRCGGERESKTDKIKLSLNSNGLTSPKTQLHSFHTLPQARLTHI